MAPNGTALAATAEVDLNDWTFKNLPAIIVATALGVVLISAAVLTFFFIFIVAIMAAVSYMLDLRTKGKISSQDAGDSVGVPLQDRLGGDEGFAEQPLIGKGGEAGADGDVDEGSEQLSESEQLPRYNSKSLLANSKAMNRHSCAAESLV